MRALRIQLALAFLFTGMALSGFSRRAAAGLLAHAWGKTEFAKPAKVFLAVTTVVPTNSSTGATLTEPTWTGYARPELPVASIAAAVEGATSSIKTALELLFAECTAGSGTIIGWALVDNVTVGAGNVEMWGTATSTSIAAGQTPKVAAGALEGTLA
jgi:hypothetical protein